MTRAAQSLVFVGPRRLEVQERPLRLPSPGEVVVRTVVSAVSAGTEMLLYRGDLEPGVSLDASLGALDGGFQYPFCYGYAAVGEVVECGAGVDEATLGRQVFSFSPHASHFVSSLSDLIFVDGMLPERAALLPTAETALGLVHDSETVAGERVLVFGLGMVGLLTAGLVASTPLTSVEAVERIAARRAVGQGLGVSCYGQAPSAERYDLVFELSGQPECLNQAIRCCGLESRIVVGSWFGTKRAPLDFGTHFHRNRLRLISSQVSHISPRLSGRWTKTRRMETARAALNALQPERWITHRVPLTEAPDLYGLLDTGAASALQAVITYG